VPVSAVCTKRWSYTVQSLDAQQLSMLALNSDIY